MLELDDDSQWHYFGYSDGEEEGSSGAEDSGVLRYGPSEFDLNLTYDQINAEEEIFTREQLRKMALEQPRPEPSSGSCGKDQEEEEGVDRGASSSNSASPVRNSGPRSPGNVPGNTANFYASEPESDNDSEGEQSKHEIQSAPTLMHLNSTAAIRLQHNPLHNDTLPASTEYQGSPSTASVPQFSRSTVGGSKAQPTAHPNAFDPDDLVFESRFESGNLGRAIKITPTYYELYLRPDMYTNRHTQWFYFRVKNTKAKMVYR